MKHFILTIAALFMSVAIHAQWKIGPKASVGYIAQKTAPIQVVPMSDYYVYDFEYVGSSPVKSFGFMAVNDMGPVFLQAEVLATTYSMEFFLNGYGGHTDNAQVYKQTHYIIEVPFNAGVKFKNTKLGLGPVLDINVDTDSEFSAMEDYRETAKSMDFGFQAMTGYSTGLFHFDVKYVYKFSSIVDGFAFGYDEMKYKKSANRLTFSVGMTF